MKAFFVAAALCGAVVAAAPGFVRPAPALEAESSYLSNGGTDTQGNQMLSPWAPALQNDDPARTVPTGDASDGAGQPVPRSATSSDDVVIIPETGVLVVPYSDAR